MLTTQAKIFISTIPLILVQLAATETSGPVGSELPRDALPSDRLVSMPIPLLPSAAVSGIRADESWQDFLQRQIKQQSQVSEEPGQAGLCVRECEVRDAAGQSCA